MIITKEYIKKLIVEEMLNAADTNRLNRLETDVARSDSLIRAMTPVEKIMEAIQKEVKELSPIVDSLDTQLQILYREPENEDSDEKVNEVEDKYKIEKRRLDFLEMCVEEMLKFTVAMHDIGQSMVDQHKPAYRK